MDIELWVLGQYQELAIYYAMIRVSNLDANMRKFLRIERVRIYSLISTSKRNETNIPRNYWEYGECILCS